MPSVSKKQQNLMEAVAHNAKFAKKVGIPRSADILTVAITTTTGTVVQVNVVCQEAMA